MTCQGEPGCEGIGVLRDCGHHACDNCTDDETGLCIPCTPVDDLDRAMYLREARVD
jgi:hypothetical protein